MFYFRADGNAAIGAGHLMRCLTVADELREQLGSAERIRFLCADEASAELVRARDYSVSVLDTDCQRMEEELPVLSKLIREAESESQRPVIVTDSYYVTDLYLEKLKDLGKVILLDDMGNHAFPADVVINYNVFAREETYEKLYRGSGCRCYVGGQYVPVRPRFRNSRYELRQQVKDVLITTGGGDRDNIAASVLEAIRSEGVTYHVVVGRFSPHFDDWLRKEKEDGKVVLHYDVKDMAGLMSRCDLAVTAGGTTVYELAAVGVPFLCFSYAENQEALAAYIGEKNIAGYCGAYHKDRAATLERMRELAVEAEENADLRCRMRDREKEMIDGLGASRIAELLRKEYGEYDDTDATAAEM